jgi:hypothetical protein
MRNKVGALRSVTRLRSAECVTTGTAGFGFFGLSAWPITQVKHAIAGFASCGLKNQFCVGDLLIGSGLGKAPP